MWHKGRAENREIHCTDNTPVLLSAGPYYLHLGGLE